jgi:hypothetical protein
MVSQARTSCPLGSVSSPSTVLRSIGARGWSRRGLEHGSLQLDQLFRLLRRKGYHGVWSCFVRAGFVRRDGLELLADGGGPWRCCTITKITLCRSCPARPAMR